MAIPVLSLRDPVRGRGNLTVSAVKKIDLTDLNCLQAPNLRLLRFARNDSIQVQLHKPTHNKIDDQVHLLKV